MGASGKVGVCKGDFHKVDNGSVNGVNFAEWY